MNIYRAERQRGKQIIFNSLFLLTITQYLRMQVTREMFRSEKQRYSKFEESGTACLQCFPLLTKHSFLFKSFLHINRVLTMSWLHRGKANAIVWMDNRNFFLNAVAFCSFSILGYIVVIYSTLKAENFNSQSYICNKKVCVKINKMPRK